jgi:hypothetical protein
MKRIYHPYNLWEDYKAGFYDNLSGKNKQHLISQVVDFFKNEELVEEKMKSVLIRWVYSCEHNLTNESMNQIAYLGQASVCIYLGIPSTITMEAWSYLSEIEKTRANSIAEKIINEYYKKQQLCLRFI